ncbi:LacI family DNA-binding transcriptional regulator [Longirhabdus pacifica]|uniref:LacI family DNA-binding transcriptional regulator n=1 Tax=Longirhabdus pacifica TaxID=2305227 RepID=UPI0010090100|nr:LacI family DNA-binding transcriptional regulator [Longirhabdus pacifica]
MKKYTIKDVANKAGVSIATVSNVINAKGRVSTQTIARVRKVIEELQYYPNLAARNLKDKKTHLIAVLVPLTDQSNIHDNPFYLELLSGIEKGARQSDLHVLLIGLKEGDNLSFIHERNLDGIIVVGVHEHSLLYENITQLHVPCVFMDSYLNQCNYDQVNIDDQLGGYLATKHLISLGHRHIVLFGGERKNNSVYHSRWLGYRKALNEARIQYREKYAIESQVTMEAAYQCAQHCIATDREITAVCVGSDVAAMGFVKGLHDVGLHVPEHISVIGFDDLFFAHYMVPTLTTIYQNITEKGTKAVELLFEQIYEERFRPAKKVFVPIQLKIGQSTREISKMEK